MSGIDDILDRIHHEPDFMRSLAEHPADLLAPYNLSTDELERVCLHLALRMRYSSATEQRVGLAPLFGLLASRIGLSQSDH